MSQKFLCDEMLVRLGKWLRIAGYDTLIAAAGSTDRELLACAVREQRILLTRDQSFLQRRSSEEVVLLLKENGMQSWVRALNRELNIDWSFAPFSRCLLCNRPLESGPGHYAGHYAGQMPAYVLDEGIPCFHCPACAKAYWQGGHVERMRRKLEQWNS